MAKLTSKRRKHLKNSQFAEPGKRKYPVDTANRARNALARVSQNGTPEEKAAVSRKVHRKYPTIAMSGVKKASAQKSRRKAHSGKRL